MRRVSSVLVLCAALCAPSAFGRDPTGEQADYMLDRDSDRTSGVIHSAFAHGVVSGPGKMDDGTPTFDIKVHYKANVLMMGTKEGDDVLQVPAEFYQPEFLVNLREDGIYVSDSFKIKHMGYRDAKNLDGHAYAHCDYLYFYDIKTSSRLLDVLVDAARAETGDMTIDRMSIQDAKVYAHIKEGVPGLGAVKIDASGTVEGFFVKAGLDYKAP